MQPGFSTSSKLYLVGMKAWPYWLKGGLLAIPLYLVIAPLTFFVAVRFIGVSDDILQFISPELSLVAWAFVGEPETSQIVLVILILGARFVARAFVVGAVLGAVYGHFAARGKRAIFFVLLIIMYLAALGALSFWLQNTTAVNYSAHSPADCRDWTKGLVKNFSTTECYRELAERNKDITICDEIRAGRGDSTAEEQKEFCYEEVAHEKKDPAICPLISASGRRDSCYLWFKICEKVSATDSRDYCWTRKARANHDPALCSNISDLVPAFTTSKCLADIQ